MIPSTDSLLTKFEPQLGEIPISPNFRNIVISFSATCGISAETAALSAIALLDGLAGRATSHLSDLAVRPPPGWNLAVVPESAAAWSAFHSLLYGPVMEAADTMRKRSRAASAARLQEWLDVRHQHGELDHPDDVRDPLRGTDFPAVTAGHYHRVAVSSQPIFYLSDPGRLELERGVTASFDRALLLDLGLTRLLDRLATSPTKEDIEIASHINRLLAGSHIAAKEHPTARNPIFLEQPTASCLMGISAEVFRSIFRAGEPAARRLLDQFIFLPAPRIAPDWLSQEGVQVEDGLADWHWTVIDLFYQRRRGSVRWLLDLSTNPLNRLGDYRRDLLQLEATLPQPLQGLCRHLLDLPIRILGALEHLAAVESTHASQQPTHAANLDAAEKLARLTVGAHIRFLLEQCEAAEATPTAPVFHFPSADDRMLEKIREKAPVSFRNLCRSYPTQRQADHRPVLQRLLDSGQVRRAHDGRLELTEEKAEETG